MFGTASYFYTSLIFAHKAKSLLFEELHFGRLLALLTNIRVEVCGNDTARITPIKKFYSIGPSVQFHKTFFIIIYVPSGLTRVKTIGNMPIVA